MRLRRERGFDDRTLMKMLCSHILRAKETSAQEAAWVLLKFPLCETSRKCTFIDTSRPEERVHCPRPNKDIMAMPAGSTDLWFPDIFDKYSARAAELDNVTLAEFAALHHQSQKPRRRRRVIRYRRYAENSEDWDQSENFYRGMCTLHLPWRDEQSDILQADDSMHSLYSRHEDVILGRRRVFEATLGLDDNMQDELEACVAEDEAEAVEAEASARGMLAGNTKLFFDADGVADFMDDDAQDINIDLPEPGRQPAAASARVRRRGVWDRETFLDSIRRLNTKQKEVVLAVVHGIRTQSAPRLIYIDGAAGTGKSVVARNIANAFEAFCPANDNEDSSRVVISAPTGKAAHNIGGSTMHHAYILSWNQQSDATRRLNEGADDIMVPLQGQALANLQNAFANVHGQIIDEISMVSDRNFLAVDQRCKEAKGNEADFGGLWTIIFGDFRQLTPVGGKPVYVSSTDSLGGSALLWQKFEYVELTQNMRQGEDKRFAEILAKIGDAEVPLTAEEREMVESRFVDENNLVVPNDCPRLYHRNDDKDAYNLRELLKAPNHQIIRLTARDRVQQTRGLLGPSRRQRHTSVETILDRARALPTRSAQNLPYLLLAVAGRPYKLTVNIDVQDGLVNGAVGVLVWVQAGLLSQRSRTPGVTEPELAVQTLWLRFSGDVGAGRSRNKHSELQAAIARQRCLPLETLPYELPPIPEADELHGLVPIEREDARLVKCLTEVWRHVMRQQFPLVPALSDTIHSSQGSSHDAACVEYYDTMQNNMVYVGMSRVRKLAGLFIKYSGTGLRRVARGRVERRPRTAAGLFKHPRLDKRDVSMAAEKQRLRSNPLTVPWASLLERPANALRAVYANVQSLHAHHRDVSLDDVMMQSDVLLLAETWLRPGQTIDLGDGMQEVVRCDAPAHQERAAGGVAVYSRLPFDEVLAVGTVPRVEAARARRGSELAVAVLYCHTDARLGDILAALSLVLPAEPCGTVIVCADFNVDMRAAPGRCIADAFAARGLTPRSDLSAPSTYYGTTIDAVFSNSTATRTALYQAYYSHHIPMVIDVT
ncbi:uncharacterized protein LOC127748812 [Frankliniella occidentalis]|uniref:ATP-dependent DNA helicase n=1 Tax=Frankliniella occidentalis TaxID=133901 RepID=A0A9C6U289_FRAOC|nr:uncharacterized protein LOC127748812 [Frankliniella occidentalis]